MKITHDLKTAASKNRVLALIAVLGMTLGLMPPASAEQHSFIFDLNSNQLTDLGSLGGGETRANAINDAGQVVGSSRTLQGETHAFMTGPNGIGMTRVGASTESAYNYLDTAVSINNSGQIVGNYASTSDPEGFRTFLHSFITGSNGAGSTHLGFQATGINDSGAVVGWNNTDVPFSTGRNAVVTGPGGEGAKEVNGLLGADDDYDQFNAINNRGQIAGNSLDYAFVSDGTKEGTTNLAPLAGNSTSSALAINGAGEIAGWAYFGNPASAYHPFIINADHTKFTDLGTLGGSNGQALGIDDAGQVVGSADTADGQRHAFVTGPHGTGMTDLNSLVHLPFGNILTDATGINNRGQIIVVGIIPEPETYAMLMAGLALVAFMSRRKKEKEFA
jgi:probable HAF family extracellular repeat protein